MSKGYCSGEGRHETDENGVVIDHSGLHEEAWCYDFVPEPDEIEPFLEKPHDVHAVDNRALGGFLSYDLEPLLSPFSPLIYRRTPSPEDLKRRAHRDSRRRWEQRKIEILLQRTRSVMSQEQYDFLIDYLGEE